MKLTHFILIGNYSLDRQESMNRYFLSLKDGLLRKGFKVTLWKPIIFFAKGQHTTNHGLGKWLGYIDKWILFPLILRLRLLKSKYRKHTYFHVCDHSNSPYLAVLPQKRSGITCHDVLAIRGALGYEDAYCPASKTGIYLQKWILNNLIKAKRIACVSQLTLNQLTELADDGIDSYKKWKVVYNSFNAHFHPMTAAQRTSIFQQYGLEDSNYILHVGSSLPRKNRKILADMIVHLGEKWKGKICYAGQPIDIALQIHIDKLGIADRVVPVVKPSHEVLVALYSGCTAFIFPSFSEGFGWPVIEAQACGAPVVASVIEPMPEVAGGAALHVDPENPAEFTAALLMFLQDPQAKKEYIRKGFQNCRRFEQSLLINQFLALYDLETND